METIYKKVIWPLYKTHIHALDALKEIIVNGNLSILNRLNINDEIKNELINILKKRWKYIPIKIISFCAKHLLYFLWYIMKKF